MAPWGLSERERKQEMLLGTLLVSGVAPCSCCTSHHEKTVQIRSRCSSTQERAPGAKGVYNVPNAFKTILSPCPQADKFCLRYFHGRSFPSSLVKLEDSEQTVHMGISQHAATFFPFGSHDVHQGISLQPELFFKTTEKYLKCVPIVFWCLDHKEKSQDRKFLCLSAAYMKRAGLVSYINTAMHAFQQVLLL